MADQGIKIEMSVDAEGKISKVLLNGKECKPQPRNKTHNVEAHKIIMMAYAGPCIMVGGIMYCP